VSNRVIRAQCLLGILLPVCTPVKCRNSQKDNKLLLSDRPDKPGAGNAGPPGGLPSRREREAKTEGHESEAHEI
jgi:hypothetical protein